MAEAGKNFNVIYTLPAERLNQISGLYNDKINKIKARIEKKRLLLEKKQRVLYDINVSK